MDLWNSSTNILPYDGRVRHLGTPFNHSQQKELFEQLSTEIKWEREHLKMFGKEIQMRRKVAWYADTNFRYTYGGYQRKAEVWTPKLKALKSNIETLAGSSYNSCLLNFYHDGEDGMGWHSDNEKELKKRASIASLSLGSGRMFKFRHKKTKEIIEIWLDPGSLLLMEDETQEFWSHAIPKSKKIKQARINLTFRTYST